MAALQTYIYIASRKVQLHCVQQLLAKGVNANAADTNGKTPLHEAAEEGHSDVVQVLLAAGANINAATKTGSTPLFLSAERGKQEVVKGYCCQQELTVRLQIWTVAPLCMQQRTQATMLL
jgi:ankyrin repeat protein